MISLLSAGYWLLCDSTITRSHATRNGYFIESATVHGQSQWHSCPLIPGDSARAHLCHPMAPVSFMGQWMPMAKGQPAWWGLFAARAELARARLIHKWLGLWLQAGREHKLHHLRSKQASSLNRPEKDFPEILRNNRIY